LKIGTFQVRLAAKEKFQELLKPAMKTVKKIHGGRLVYHVTPKSWSQEPVVQLKETFKKSHLIQ
jgi:hypothetical protein